MFKEVKSKKRKRSWNGNHQINDLFDISNKDKKIIIIPSIRSELMLINKIKRICHLEAFVVPADNWIKIKEN